MITLGTPRAAGITEWMIVLHRIGPEHKPFRLNPDLVMTIDANPDTVITLTVDGTKLVVAETPEVVDERIVEYRARILQRAFGQSSPLALPPAAAEGLASGERDQGGDSEERTEAEEPE